MEDKNITNNCQKTNFHLQMLQTEPEKKLNAAFLKRIFEFDKMRV